MIAEVLTSFRDPETGRLYEKGQDISLDGKDTFLKRRLKEKDIIIKNRTRVQSQPQVMKEKPRNGN